jgi:hypothetical protein
MRSLGRVLLAGGESGPGGWFFPRARLRPKPLGYPPGAERDGETRNLIEWYKRHGYRATTDSGFKGWQKETMRRST